MKTNTPEPKNKKEPVKFLVQTFVYEIEGYGTDEDTWNIVTEGDFGPAYDSFVEAAEPLKLAYLALAHYYDWVRDPERTWKTTDAELEVLKQMRDGVEASLREIVG